MLKAERGIARMRARIAKWETEAGEVEASWTGGSAYRRFCREMAGTARLRKEELEEELRRFQDRQVTEQSAVASAG